MLGLITFVLLGLGSTYTQAQPVLTQLPQLAPYGSVPLMNSPPLAPYQPLLPPRGPHPPPPPRCVCHPRGYPCRCRFRYRYPVDDDYNYENLFSFLYLKGLNNKPHPSNPLPVDD